MHSDIEQGDPSSTNVNPAGIIEQNITIENDMIIDQMFWDMCWGQLIH